MFVGGVNKKLLDWLSAQRDHFTGRNVVVGCSGSFGIEAALIQGGAKPESIHSNDVSLYSCALGMWLAGRACKFHPSDNAPDWLRNVWDDGNDARGIAILHVLLDMLPFEKQNNAYKRRMWQGYLNHLDYMVNGVEATVAGFERGLTSFYAGDVAEHFRRHDSEDAIFMCYLPTYKGGYERMYKRLHELFTWDAPSYDLIDKGARNHLLEWLEDGRSYLWVDDRRLEGRTPTVLQERGAMRSVYLYSNIVQKPAYFGKTVAPQPKLLPLAGAETFLVAREQIEVLHMGTGELKAYKDMFLNKKIMHSAGMHAFAFAFAGHVLGFVELMIDKLHPASLYLNSDFSVPFTRYKHLSKLISALALSEEVRHYVSKATLLPFHTLRTTAFTDKPISMKYRGVFELEKRGQHADGRKYLNYAGKFAGYSAQEIYEQWLLKHGSKVQ